MKHVVYQDPIAEIYLNGEVEAIVISWKTTPTSAEFRKILAKGLEIVKSHKLNKWIGDCTNMGAIDPEDQQWSNVNWFPKALELGIDKMGVIVSDDIFNRMSIEEIMNNVDGSNFVSQYFPTVEKAIEWMG